MKLLKLIASWFKSEPTSKLNVPIEENELVGLLRDCVSETWGAKSLGEVQKLFDEFIKRRSATINHLSKRN